MKYKTLLFSLFTSIISFSQLKLPQTDNNIQKYIDDGRLELAKNAIKFDVGGLINLDFCAVYERKLSSLFSIDIGAGVNPKYFPVYERFSQEIELKNYPKKFGTTFHIMPKLYFNKGAIDFGKYIGFVYKQRNFNSDKTTFKEFLLIFGNQELIKKTKCLEYGYGFGLQVITIDKEPYFSYLWNIKFSLGKFFGKQYYESNRSKKSKSKKGEENEE